ncbi:MAG: translation initiation factor IF-2 [Clostridiales bacterium]|uniref:Translation initiation factor IF-2 n=1 Tax=Candidatus Scybalenecus merdavium TaxID=2840939 RepID=A0A9D1MVY8_9FIRM|nr:translation initiation factor IF-2 [Clostridiales bacterium]HIU69736.1 translation initiation factor IF-2 [Candidatus Scubalenecus merdavium]
MVIKQKLSDVAADFGKKNKELIDLLADYTDGPPKKANNVLTEQDLDIIIDKLTASSVIDDADKYLERFAKKGGQKPAKKQQSKKQQAQAAILQMAEQAAKRAEEKAKKKAETVPQARTKGAAHHVDTRSSNVDLEKYNQKYEDIAPSRSISDLSTKQKLNQKSKQYRKKRPQGMHAHSKRETEQQRLARIKEQRKKQQIVVKIPEEITIGELASLLRMTAAEVIKKAFQLGVTATINETIDFDTAEIIAIELGAKVEKKVERSIEEQIIEDTQDTDENTVPRSPVVCVMGHVDHGKTSILDAIRHTSVTDTEAGGITQHIGAYQVNCGGQRITFLDTPGHAAFTAMRARGAMATDIAVLVVAADDGIMPQTVEAINHAKAAGVEIIVAINKMDKEGADPQRVMQQLTEYSLVPEEWGGDVICVPVSAKTGMGLDKLLETILLVAEMSELRANPDRAAKGVVIEAKLDKGRGPIATLLVQNGTLRTGDIVVAGTSVGKIRAMVDFRGKKINSAGPSVPVEIMGLDSAPMSGDTFDVASDERLARQLVEQRREKEKTQRLGHGPAVSLDNLFDALNEGSMKELCLIVKADVQGSVEAVKQSLMKIENDEVRVNIILGGVGAVNENDVMLASASGAMIIGFNVGVDPSAADNAQRDGIEIKTYSIIYDLINDITDAMRGMRAPKYRDVDIGTVEVREVYKVSTAGTIAGSLVTGGVVRREGKCRILRGGKQIGEAPIASLKRFKDDAKEVSSGYECGISLKDWNDIVVGDTFEVYITEEYRD